MLRTIFWISWMFGYFFVMLPKYWKAKRLGRQGKREEQQAMVRFEVKRWAQKLLRHIGTTVTVEGMDALPKDQPVVFAANHQSYVDIPVMLGSFERAYPLMAKKELGKVPLMRGWMQLLGCVFVDRDDARAAVGALRAAEHSLARGDSFIVFPEGTRSQSNEVGEFKAGAVRIAYKAGVPIVPVVIDGTYRSLEGNHWKLQKNHVRLVILPAIPTTGMSRAAQKELPQQLEQIIRDAKAEKSLPL